MQAFVRPSAPTPSPADVQEFLHSATPPPAEAQPLARPAPPPLPEVQNVARPEPLARPAAALDSGGVAPGATPSVTDIDLITAVQNPIPVPPPAPRGATLDAPPPPKARVSTHPRAPELERAEAAARDLLTHIEAQVAVEKDPLRLGRLHFEWGRLLEVPLFDFVGARSHYQKAFELIPAHDGVIEALVRVASLGGDPALTLRYLESAIKNTRLPAERAAKLLEKGQLLEDRMGRAEEARRAYELASELAPHDAGVLRALARRLRSEKAWEELDGLLSSQVELAGADPFLRAARLARRARLAEVKRQNRSLAAELYELSFQAAPDASAALAHLERLHAIEDHPAALAQTLSRKTGLIGDPAARAAALEWRASIEGDDLGDPEAALQSLELAIQVAPGDRELLRRLADQYLRAGRVTEALSALERLDALLTDPREQCAVRLRAARLVEQELKDQRLAVTWYERARSAQPESAAANLPLVRLYKQVGAYGPLVEVLLGEENVSTDPARRAALLHEVAEIYETRLGSAQEARTYHARALAVLPGYAPSERALARLYADARMTPELIELYERAAEQTSDQGIRHRYLFKIASLYEDWLGEHQKALLTYKRILSDAPTNSGALFGAQTAAERAGDYPALILLLQTEAEQSGELAQKTALLLRAADTARDKLGDLGQAQVLYERVLAVDSRSRPAISGLVRVFEAGGRTEEMLEARRREVELVTDSAIKAQILFEIADVFETQVGSLDRAVAHLKRAVAADRNHFAARERLAELLSRTGQFEDLAKHLADDAARVTEPDLKASLLSRLGRLYENVLNRPEEALASYTEAARLKPTLRTAVDGELRLLAKLGKLKEFAEGLARDAKLTVEPRITLWESLMAGEVLCDELGDASKAVEPVEQLLERFPRHPLALLMLEEAYAELGQTDSLRRVLHEQIAQFGPAEQVGALRELLRLAPEEQKMHYVSALLDRQPADRSGLLHKERAALLDRDLPALAQADSVLADGSGQPLAAAQHRVRLGEFLEHHDPAQALAAFRSALELDPESFGAARGYGRVAERLGDAGLLTEAADLEARVTGDKKRASWLLVRAAKALEERGQVTQSVALLERALEQNPNDRDAADHLGYFLARIGDPGRLVTSLSAAAQAATDPEAIVSHWMTVARVYEEHHQNRGAAIAALTRIEKLMPDHLGGVIALGELYLRDRQFAPAAQKLERAIALTTDREDRIRLEVELAGLYLEHLGRKADARRLLDAVLKRDPHHRGALQRLLALQIESRDPGAYDTAQKWVEIAEGNERVVALTQFGRLERDRGRPAEARDVFLSALALAGASPEGPLGDLYGLITSRDEGELRRMASALSAHARSPQFAPKDRAESAYQAGLIWLDRVGDLVSAERSFEECLALDRGHVLAREALVTTSERAHNLPSATLRCQELVQTDSLRKESWLLLRRLFLETGRSSESVLTQGPLALLGAASEADMAEWSRRIARPALVAPGSARDALTTVMDPIVEQGGEALWLLNQLSGLGPKVFRGGLEAAGLSSRDRIGPKTGHPLRAPLDKVMRAFGLTELDLYPEQSNSITPRLVLTDPLGIIVPMGLLNLRDADQVFLLGELVAGVSLGIPLAFALSEDEVLRTLVAAARQLDPSYLLPGVTPGPELDELTRRVKKAPSWLSKGRFEDRVRSFLREPGPDARLLLRSVRRSARLAALLLADDLSPIELLHQSGGAALRVASSDVEAVTRDLLADWVSARASDARRRMGLI